MFKSTIYYEILFDNGHIFNGTYGVDSVENKDSIKDAANNFIQRYYKEKNSFSGGMLQFGYTNIDLSKTCYVKIW